MTLSKKDKARIDEADLLGFHEAPRSGSLFNAHAPHVFRLPRATPGEA